VERVLIEAFPIAGREVVAAVGVAAVVEIAVVEVAAAVAA